MKNKHVNIESEIERLLKRVDDQIPVSRFIVRMQLDQLIKAEKLRKLVLQLIKSQWQHRCSDRTGGCTAVSDSKLEALAKFANGLASFHIKRPLPTSVRKLISTNRRSYSRQRGAEKNGQEITPKPNTPSRQ